MSFFSRNATNQQTFSTTKPSGLSNAADYSTTVTKNGKEIITTKYIDLTGLHKANYSTTGVISNNGSSSNNYLLKHREYDNGRIYKIEMIVLDLPEDSTNNSFNVGLVYELSDSKEQNESITSYDLITSKSWSSILYKEDVSQFNLSALFYNSESVGSNWQYNNTSKQWTSSTSHGRVVGDIVKLSYVDSGAEPSQYVANKNYFVVEIGSNSENSEETFKLSETEGGDPVSTSSNSGASDYWDFYNYDNYLYLTGGNTDQPESAIAKGKFLIKLYGHEV